MEQSSSYNKVNFEILLTHVMVQYGTLVFWKGEHILSTILCAYVSSILCFCVGSLILGICCKTE